MFNQTKHHPPGELDRMFEEAGAEVNAATWVDWTHYYENLPSGSIDLAIELESDRMASLVLRDPQVRSEKEVVANERSLRVEDDVEGAANEQLYKAAFRKHPYGWPTIGWMEDIRGFTTEDCRAFYRTYYAPNNATIVVVGDFDEKDVLAKIARAYGGLRSARIPELPRIVEPPQRAERRVRLHRETPTEKVLVGYRGAALADADYAVLTIANEILFGGRSGRMYRRLVEKDALCTDVQGSLAPFADPGLWEMWLEMRPGKKLGRGLAVLDEELAKIRDEPVSLRELDKAKNRLELSQLESLETANGKADQIGFYETVLGDGTLGFRMLERCRAVQKAHLSETLERVLQKRARTIVEVLPDGHERSRGRAR
jgi:zinc protease